VFGVPHYYAWFEMYPAFPVNLSMSIHPGDAIAASVAASDTGDFTLSITNTTTAESFTTTRALPRAARSSAEWIVEAPSSSGVLPLAPFTPVTFTEASFAVDGGTAGPISSAPNVQITMANPSGAKATPSTLDSTGTSFTVKFSAPAPATTTSPPHRRHHSNNVGVTPAASSGASSATTPSAVALATVLVNEAPPQVLPGLPVTPTQATVLTPAPTAAAPVLPSSFGLPGALPGRSASGDTLDGGGGDQALVTDSAPAANQPGAPGDQPAPDAKPDAAPAPMSKPAPDDSRGQLDGTAVALGQAPDAASAEFQWEPAARLEGVRAWVGRVEEEGTTFEAGAGVAFALALSGTWGVATEEAEGRRRRQRPF
jgi:Peptidase A4 family